MRAYVAITPSELQTFLDEGFLEVSQALIVDPKISGTTELNQDDQEELEFETSWSAAVLSRTRQSLPGALGLVLAVDLEKEQLGKVEGNHVGLLSNLSWPQVQSLLLSDSGEPELSWFAPQEIPIYLPNWLT